MRSFSTFNSDNECLLFKWSHSVRILRLDTFQQVELLLTHQYGYSMCIFNEHAEPQDVNFERRKFKYINN